LLGSSKWILLIAETAAYASFFFSFLVSFIPLSIGQELHDIILFSIPWSLLFGLSCHYCSCFHMFQVTYFHIICSYLKIKLTNINHKINSLTIIKKRKTHSHLDLLKSLKSIILEFNSINQIYWSKFIAIFFANYLCMICIVLYVTIYGQLGFVLSIIALYTSLIFITLLSLLTTTASANVRVFYQTYRLLNNFLLSNRVMRITRKLKVFICLSSYLLSIIEFVSLSYYSFCHLLSKSGN
jgi:hypothetical protein